MLKEKTIIITIITNGKERRGGGSRCSRKGERGKGKGEGEGERTSRAAADHEDAGGSGDELADEGAESGVALVPVKEGAAFLHVAEVPVEGVAIVQALLLPAAPRNFSSSSSGPVHTAPLARTLLIDRLID